MTSALFSPISLRGLTLPNRIVVSPMCQYNSVDGSATDWHILQLGQFSLGGSGGLVMTEATNVSMAGRITPKCATLCNDDNEQALKRVIDFCRQYGVAAHGIQLGHAGRKGSTLPPALGGKRVPGAQGRLLLHQQLLVRCFPGLPRNDRRRLHCYMLVHRSSPCQSAVASSRRVAACGWCAWPWP